MVNFLHRCWGQRNIKCLEEPRIITETGLQKPDLLVLRNNITLIIDVQIRADSGLEDLDVLHDEKCAKYANAALHKALTDKYNNTSIKSLSVTYNWRGTMSLKLFKTLKSECLIKNKYVSTIGYQICRATAKMVAAYWRNS